MTGLQAEQKMDTANIFASETWEGENSRRLGRREMREVGARFFAGEKERSVQRGWRWRR
jgi:hypothetical protein